MANSSSSEAAGTGKAPALSGPHPWRVSTIEDLISPPRLLGRCTLKSAGGSFIRPYQQTILPYDRGRFLPLQGEFGSRMAIRETFGSWKRASRWRQLFP